MDEEAKTLQGQLESFYSAVEEAKSFDPELAQNFLEAFEEFEITIDGYMKPEQYVDFMVLYFVTDNWHNPAKFLWKRIPTAMKKDKMLVSVWDIGKLLFQSKYLEAAKKISSFKLGKLSEFLAAGYRYHMQRLIEQAYANIDDKTYRALMGFTSAKQQKEYQTHFDEELRHKGKYHNMANQL